MEVGHFYFLTDQYFIDFPDQYLTQNKETIGGKIHDRPCFYAFQDSNTGLYWMVPFSSRVDKFKGIYQAKLHRYGKCDTIAFGEVLGSEKAFLIQNMCPVTQRYIKNQYIDATSMLPVRIDGALESQIVQQAKKVLALQRKGAKLIFPDVLWIEKELLQAEEQATDSEPET